MAELTIKGPCSICDGDGIRFLWNGEINPDGTAVGPVETVCAHCDEGRVAVHTISIPQLDEILSFIELPLGVFSSRIVYEAIDNQEYKDLGADPGERRVDGILSCGAVDLNEGSRARTVLWNKFDAESTTRANLIALIG